VAVAALAIPALLPRAAAHLPGTPVLAEVGSDAVRSGASIQHSPLAPGLVQRPAQTILVNQGDSVESLAATFHADAGAIRWANAVPDVSQPGLGTSLLIPPGPGALVPVEGAAELPSHVASRLGLDPRVILDYNAFASDTPIPAGSYVQVPTAAAPASALQTTYVVPVRAGIPGVPATQLAKSSTNGFPYGQCTYYVASRRDVTWGGDAWSWYDNARSKGRPVGQIPVERAVVVQNGGWAGHVAYVERVNLDGSFVVSEWNVRGWGVYDERTIPARSRDVVGFVY
jgi:surface antigen